MGVEFSCQSRNVASAPLGKPVSDADLSNERPGNTGLKPTQQLPEAFQLVAPNKSFLDDFNNNQPYEPRGASVPNR